MVGNRGRMNAMKRCSAKDQTSLELMSAVSLVLGILTLVSGMVYLVYRFLNDKAYRDKWKDYDDCGMM